MWYHKRHLPHDYPPEAILFLTWRLFGSLTHVSLPERDSSNPGKAFAEADRLLDTATAGPLWLKRPALAEMVIGYQRDYELACYAIEHYPKLREPVTSWFKDFLNHDMADLTLARELLLYEKKGHFIRFDDPLLSRLPQETRDRIQRAIEMARVEEGYRRPR